MCPKSNFISLLKLLKLIFHSSFGLKVRKKEGVFSSPSGAKDYSKNDHHLPVILHIYWEIFCYLKWNN